MDGADMTDIAAQEIEQLLKQNAQLETEMMDLWRINGVMQENKPEIFNEKTIKRLLIEREEMLEVLYRIKDSNVFLGAIAKEMMDQVLEKAETLSTSLEQRGEK